ncbi:MAG: anti-sigma factor [Candidatus Acidiferrales bacterium]
MNGHPTREEDFDLYTLGALEGDEKQALEEHLRGCPECTRKLAEARGRVALFALAAPQQPPDPRVKERLMPRVRGSRRVRITAHSYMPERASIFSIRWWTVILAPAAAALAIATIVLWTSDNRERRELEALRVEIRQQETQIAQSRAMLDVLSAKDTIAVNLTPSPDVPGAKGFVFFNSRQGVVLSNCMLPALPPDKTYQLWLVPSQGNPVSAGVFAPKYGQEASLWTTPVPAGLTAKAFAVTVEPAGGKPQPTGPKVLIGPVS